MEDTAPPSGPDPPIPGLCRSCDTALELTGVTDRGGKEEGGVRNMSSGSMDQSAEGTRKVLTNCGILQVGKDKWLPELCGV